jgi:hypothetical protein
MNVPEGSGCVNCKHLHITFEYGGTEACTGINMYDREKLMCTFLPKWEEINKYHWCSQWKEQEDD